MPQSSIKQYFNPALIWGLVFVAVLAFVSTYLSKLPFFTETGLGALTIAIILGMLIGNTFFSKIADHTGNGVDFSKNKLLRLGIIFYGFGVTLQEIGGVGGRGIIIDIVIVTTVFFLGLFLGRKLFGLDRESSILISTGSAICGAAAIMAAEPILKTQAHKVTIAVATVVVFGTISLFLYPLLYPYMGLNEHQFGIYIGSTVHEVAQVVAAGKGVSEATATDAVIVKMIRVMLLVPFLLFLSAWQAKRSEEKALQSGTKPKIMIPWFALMFILASVIASLNILPVAVIDSFKSAGTLLLAMAMAALGLRTHYSSIKQAGVKPLALALLLFLFLVIGGGLINIAILKI